MSNRTLLRAAVSSLILSCIAAVSFGQTTEPAGPIPAPITGPKAVITDFGAKADGTTINTAAIQKAIDDLAAKGGGTLIIPAASPVAPDASKPVPQTAQNATQVVDGAFLTGALFLKPGVNLRVEKGAILKGSTNAKDYPTQNTRIEGHFQDWLPALINAEGCDHLRIDGEGVLDGSGTPFYAAFRNARSEGRPTTNVGTPRPDSSSSPNVRMPPSPVSTSSTPASGTFTSITATASPSTAWKSTPRAAPLPPTASTSTLTVTSPSKTPPSPTTTTASPSRAPKARTPARTRTLPPTNTSTSPIASSKWAAASSPAAAKPPSSATSRSTTAPSPVPTPVASACCVSSSARIRHKRTRTSTSATSPWTASAPLFPSRPWAQYETLQGRPKPPHVVRNISLTNIKGSFGNFGSIAAAIPADIIEKITLENIDVKFTANGNPRFNSVHELVAKNVKINGSDYTPSAALTQPATPSVQR